MKLPWLAPILNGVFTLLALLGIGFNEELRDAIGSAIELLIGGLILLISLMPSILAAFKKKGGAE